MANNTLPRGAKPTPKHKLLAAAPHVVVSAAPVEFAVVPSRLSMWLNNQYGVCCTSEEAFAKAVWSTYCGLPETFVSDAEIYRFAKKYGWLDGAYLTEVMDAMMSEGFNVDGVFYKDGGYRAVDYSNESVLQSAIFSGPVKLGMDADALPSKAGSVQGWYAIGGRPGQYGNEDHCTGLCAFGSAEFLYKKLYDAGLISSPAVPAALVGKKGYLFFTWSTIGFVDHAWIMSTVQEAWVRYPTTPGQSPAPSPPPPPSPPVPPPPPPPVPPVPISIPVTVTNRDPITVTIGLRSATIPAGKVTSVGKINLPQTGSDDDWSLDAEAAPMQGVFLDGLKDLLKNPALQEALWKALLKLLDK